MFSSNYVYVPVPANRVNEVIVMLASTMPPQPESGGRPEEGPKESAGYPTGRTFSSEEVRLLKKHLKLSGVVALFDLTATRPDEWIGFEEIANVAKLSKTQLRGQLGALTKLMNRLYKRPEWPIRWNWNIEGKNESPQAYYLMESAIADVWKN